MEVFSPELKKRVIFQEATILAQKAIFLIFLLNKFFPDVWRTAEETVKKIPCTQE